MERYNIEKHLKPMKKDNNFRYWDFKNLADLLKVVEIPYEDNGNYSKVYDSNHFVNRSFASHSNAKKSKHDTFFYTNNAKDAIKLCKTGWESGAEKINSILKTKIKLGTKTAYRPTYDVVGGNCSVPRYLNGVPTNMINKKTVYKPEKIIKVYKSFGYHGGFSSDEILEDTVKTIQIINYLESKGYRCELYTCKYNVDTSSQRFAVRVKIKEAGQPLNIKKISFPLANTDIQRRLFWRLIELNPDFTQPFAGYGRGVDVSINAKDMVDKSNQTKNKFEEDLWGKEKNALYIPMMLVDVEDFIKNIDKVL